MRKMFRVYVKDVHDAARPEDRPYFRESREKNMKGKTLESFTADRATHLPAIRTSLAPLRTHLQKFPFLGGSSPNFADYIALGGFYWAASAGTLPLLERDDSLRDWLERGFNLYGGIARRPGNHAAVRIVILSGRGGNRQGGWKTRPLAATRSRPKVLRLRTLKHPIPVARPGTVKLTVPKYLAAAAKRQSRASRSTR